MTFNNLNLIEPILEAIKKEGYIIPSPIQAQAIPHLLAGKDLIGISQTGSGKTAAFLLPIIQKLFQENRRPVSKSPRALILSPTRELAAQIDDSCKTYGKFAGLKHTVVYGGIRQNPQVNALVRGVDILVATPGRLMDLMDQGHVNLDLIEIFVLDEADRMLDMGFVKDIRKLLPYLPEKRQTIMFSATMSSEVDKLARDFLSTPVKLDLAPRGSTVDTIKQELFFVDKDKKLDLLLYLMKQNLDHVIIFTRTKAAADKVAKFLYKAKISADAIHGDKTQAQRTRVLDNFQRGKITLVATDVAARGIDVDGISHVINFDLPNEADNYTHRIGRTGRAGADGIALSFCDETEKDYLNAIQKLTGKRLEFSQHPFHSEKARNSTLKARRGGGNATPKGGPSGFKRGRAVGRSTRSDGPKRSFSRSDSSDRPKRSFGGRDSSERKPSFGRSSDSPRKPSFGGRDSSERKPFARRDGDAPARKSYSRSDSSDRKPSFTRRDSSDRKPSFGRSSDSPRKPSFGGRDSSERKPFARRDGDSERKPFVRKEGSSERKPAGKKPFAKRDSPSSSSKGKSFGRGNSRPRR